MKEELATKKDLKTTKNELETALKTTKNELETALKTTKNELKTALKTTKNELETALKTTKKDLEGRIDVVDWKIGQVENKLSDFKDETGQKLDTIITAVDGLARLITDGQTEKAAMNSALYRHEDMLENHEIRIDILEKKK